eukprot:21407-Heterococcus_DN1.PRE.2
MVCHLCGASQVDQLAAKSIAEVLSEPEGQRLQQQEFVHVDAEAPLSYASDTITQYCYQVTLKRSIAMLRSMVTASTRLLRLSTVLPSLSYIFASAVISNAVSSAALV